MALAVTVTRKDEFDSYADPNSPGHDGRGYFYFRVSKPPRDVEPGTLVWAVYQGSVRGCHQLYGVVELTEDSVKEMPPVTAEGWQSGWKPGAYFVRHASTWRPLAQPVPMKGFRGFRYLELEGDEERTDAR